MRCFRPQKNKFAGCNKDQNLKNRYTNTCLTVFLFVIAYCPLSAQFSYKMEGEVVYDGKALSGAIASLFNSSGKEKEMLTNTDGTFSFSLKPNEEYSIFVTKQGFTKSEIICSTLGFSEEGGKKFKGFNSPKIELFKLPRDEASVLRINEILSTPTMSYYYDSDKNMIVADESLEESLLGELAKIQQIVDEDSKKADPELEKEKQFKKEIANGDRAFTAKNYMLAKTSYEQALAVKPNETYPKIRIAEINKLVADANEKERIAREKEDMANAAEKERIAKIGRAHV